MATRRTPEEIIEEQREKALRHKARLEAALQQIEIQRGKIQAKQSKINTRRQFLMGGFLMECLSQQCPYPADLAEFRHTLLGWLTKDRDKALFDDEYWAELGAFQPLDGGEEAESLITEDAELEPCFQGQLGQAECVKEEPSITRIFDGSWSIRQCSKLGRNAPCWCGNAQKYKNCHLQDDRLKLWAPEPS